MKRGRLVHLEALGLAERHGRRFRLDGDLDGRRRWLQISRDIIWTINQRRLETGRTAEIVREGRVTGKLVRVGFHEELGASPSVVARDVHGVEHYARLAMSSGLPSVGAQATLGMGAHGMAQLVGRAASHQAGMEL